ncbi:MAG: hypothetical protein IJ175_07080 [Clostridia bacterium]|nr:hypothetical protein [Clostridia bacterium]
MAKQANAGELSTRVRFIRETKTINENGFPVHEPRDVFGKPVYCRWVWAHGSEVFEHMELKLGQVATLTMYASPLVTVDCRVQLVDERALVGTDLGLFEIVSIDSVENRGRFMEIKVKRKVKA